MEHVWNILVSCLLLACLKMRLGGFQNGAQFQMGKSPRKFSGIYYTEGQSRQLQYFLLTLQSEDIFYTTWQCSATREEGQWEPRDFYCDEFAFREIPSGFTAAILLREKLYTFLLLFPSPLRGYPWVGRFPKDICSCTSWRLSWEEWETLEKLFPFLSSHPDGA